MRESLLDRIDGGELVINLRAEADPARLQAIVEEAIAGSDPELSLKVEHWEAFRPAAPVPVHRDTVAQESTP